MAHHPNARVDAFVERFDALGSREGACRLRSSRALTIGGTPVLLLRYDATIERLASGIVGPAPGTVRVSRPVR
ncbi:hypothetical protein HN371_28360 [Candidatus Poribacteria bacterium]|jgi:hypothetical protein|nr:hypothetical protein [Candidatus Poribacteria bacterium]MBT5532197.1 hypothetical protein [Candidatus Poribacteria bacterium]MBT5711096.1 hypothetical protein [Candidatus Poribacteria bacterium]MBT7806884.1 hypothetical protein [Candidatus Poribacteria bacterium]